MAIESLFTALAAKQNLPIWMFAVGQGMGIGTTLAGGAAAEEIGEARADIDRANAEAARSRAEAQVDIVRERGKRLIETQKSRAAAGNIRINVGSPVVIEAQTKADIARDMTNILEQGETEASFYESRAALSEAVGDMQREQSVWSAISSGLMGLGSIAYMGTELGWGNKTKIPKTITPQKYISGLIPP